MEIKKQLLIKVLTKLKPYRNLAEGILALIESRYADEKTIDDLLHLLAESSKDMKKGKEKNILIKGLTIIKKIQDMEAKDKEKEGDIEKLLEAI